MVEGAWRKNPKLRMWILGVVNDAMIEFAIQDIDKPIKRADKVLGFSYKAEINCGTG